MCIRSFGDCVYRCVYTADCSAACYTDLRDRTEMPEQDVEREGSLLRGTSNQAEVLNGR